MKASSDIKPAPFYRKTAPMAANPENDLSISGVLSFDQDGASSSASGRKFLRRQRNTDAVARPRVDSGGVLQFVTSKKLQEIRANASCLSPESTQLLTQLQEQLEGGDKTHRSPPSHLERLRHQRVLGSGIGIQSQRNLHTQISSPTFGPLPIQIQTSGLISPPSDKKVIDHRTRPGTPHKEDIRASPNISEPIKNPGLAPPLRDVKDSKETKDDRRVKLLETRIVELEQLLSQTDSYRERCDELEAKLTREVSLSTANSQRITKLMQENQKKQLEIDLTREELANACQSGKKPNPNIKLATKTKPTTSLTTKKILESQEYQALQAQNTKLKQELDTMKSNVRRLETDNAKLKRSSKMLETRLSEIETTQKQALREELKRAHSDKEKRLQDELAIIKEQLDVALNMSRSPLQDQLTAIQSELMLTKRQLDYYHLMAHCTKRQLEETRMEVDKRVSSMEHNELKAKFRNVSKKLREMVLHKSHRNSQEFELTPEKPHHSGIVAQH